MVNKFANDIISKYKKETNLEFEIRFRDINKGSFRAIFEALKKDPKYSSGTLEFSINTISKNVFERATKIYSDNTQYIRHQIFTNGIKTEDKLTQKIKVSKPVRMYDYIQYTINLNKENDSKSFTTSNTDALVRFKIRASFDYPKNDPKWRFDLTCVKHGLIQEIGPVIKQIKNDLFITKPAITINNFFETVQFDLINQFEVEIEHIPTVLNKTNFNIDDLSIVKNIFLMIEPEYLNQMIYKDEIYHVAKNMLNNPELLPSFKTRPSLKRLSNQAIALTKNSYGDIFPPINYYVTEKADGIRCIISINGNICRILADKLINIETTCHKSEKDKITIADGELIYTNPEQTTYNIYLFDVMIFRNENLTIEGFSSRVDYIEPVAKYINKYTSADPNNKFPKKVNVVSKKFFRLNKNNLKKSFSDILDAKYPYETDGLIITSGDDSYGTTTSYKWKPLENTTIDFLAIKCPKNMLNIKPYIKRAGYELYLLFNGISSNMHQKLGLVTLYNYKQLFPNYISNGKITERYYPIQFSPSSSPLAYLYYHKSELDKQRSIDYSIVELRKETISGDWKFLKVRDDRKFENNYFGNDFMVAEDIWQNYINPFPKKELWDLSTGYFSASKLDMYYAPNGYKSFTKSLLIKAYFENKNWIVDLASGKGQDLNRFQSVNIKNTLFIDRDSTALTELIRRKYDLIKRNRGSYNKNQSSMVVHTMVGDLTSPYAKTLERILEYGVNEHMIDGVVMNFAIHYMCTSVENLRNLIFLISKLLKKGGVFMFTTMSGGKIFELLNDISTNDKWFIKQDDIVKYAIKKLYSGKKLSSVGQNISVKLPFSGDEFYEEPLANIDYIIKEFERHGFALELNESFDKKFGDFNRANKNMSENLTEDDKFYISLHQYVSLIKIK